MSVSSTAFQFKHKIQLKNVAFSCAAVKASKRYQKDIGLYGMKQDRKVTCLESCDLTRVFSLVFKNVLDKIQSLYENCHHAYMALFSTFVSAFMLNNIPTHQYPNRTLEDAGCRTCPTANENSTGNSGLSEYFLVLAGGFMLVSQQQFSLTLQYTSFQYFFP